MKLKHNETLTVPQTGEGDGQPMRQLRALSEAAVAFSSSLDLDETLSRIAREACRIAGFRRCFILLLDEARQHLSLCGSSLHSRRPYVSTGRGASSGLCLPVDDPEVSCLLETTRPVFFDDCDVPGGLRPLLGASTDGPAHVLLIPLALHGPSLGLILLAGSRKAEGHGELDPDVAALLGYHATAAIRNAQSVRSVNLQLFETVARGKREWEQTFDAISDGIFITNTERVVIRANQAFAAKFNVHPRDIIGKKCHEVVWGNPVPCPQCLLDSGQADSDHPPSVTSVECGIRGMISQITAYPVLDSGGELSAVVHIVKDVTEQKRLQELVIRSEKLRAIGEMASGIAHDFNNLLSSIVGWSDIMLLADLTSQLRECAMAIHQAAMDGTETVKRIQEYTRIRKDTEFSSVDINEAIRGAVELARPRWKDAAEKAGITISLTTEFAAVSPARGNASDLREVFLNIILNAIDAMPEGGDIKMVTGQRGDSVFAAISDSGVGMSDEVVKSIFDPFFTTKGSAGSGLGLSIAYGIVSRHDGELTVESTLGKGSTFTVVLPIAPAAEQKLDLEAPYLAHKARVLLIDDDERVLGAVEALLRTDGHSVTKCLGGKQGISAFSRRLYDLVITDLGMAEVNGWEVAAKVKAASPDTPVVLLTGWGAEIAVEHLSELGIDGIIQKPCRLPVLRQTINQVLRRKKAVREASAPCEPGVEAGAEPAIEPHADAGRKLKVLVVEDNKWFGEALQERLKIDGHRVSLVTSGQDGIEALKGNGYDIVLTDLKLPDASGLELAARVKRSRRRPFVALMTGDSAALDGSLLRAEGVDAVLPKPWKEAELQTVIDRVRRRGPGK
ncbi:MAG: response regulator [Chloroflexi bacterium]|nr:response regulator [Chloroflexota bacterium]